MLRNALCYWRATSQKFRWDCWAFLGTFTLFLTFWKPPTQQIPLHYHHFYHRLYYIHSFYYIQQYFEKRECLQPKITISLKMPSYQFTKWLCELWTWEHKTNQRRLCSHAPFGVQCTLQGVMDIERAVQAKSFISRNVFLIKKFRSKSFAHLWKIVALLLKTLLKPLKFMVVLCLDLHQWVMKQFELRTKMLSFQSGVL